MKKWTENELSYAIRGIIYDVYKELGPGLLESIYVAALSHELTKKGFKTAVQVPLPGLFKGEALGMGYRIDILVEDLVVLEIKSVDMIADVHVKQLITYLKLSGKKLGLLVNFNTDNIFKSIVRKVNGLEDPQRFQR